MDNKLHCSFCGKAEDAIEKLFAGPVVNRRHVFICSECVDTFHNYLVEERSRGRPVNSP